MGLAWEGVVGLGFATVWRMVRWGVDAARCAGLGGVAGAGDASLLMTSFNDGTFCAETVCHGEPPRAVLADIWLSLSLAADCALAACCCCNFFLRSFCESFGAGRLNGDDADLSEAAFCDSIPCDKDDVLTEEACAMMSLRPVFDAPARGVAVQGSPLLGGVRPPSKGDFGVLGVIAPGV